VHHLVLVDVVQPIQQLQEYFVPVGLRECGVALLGAVDQLLQGRGHELHQHQLAVVVHHYVDYFDDEPVREGAEFFHACNFTQC